MSDLDLSKWRISTQAERTSEMQEKLREGHQHARFLDRFLHKIVCSYGALAGYGEPGQIEKLRMNLRCAKRRFQAWTGDPSNSMPLRESLRFVGRARGWAMKLKDEGSPPVSEFIESVCFGMFDIYDFQEAACFTLQEEHDEDCACEIANRERERIAQ